MIRVLKYAAPFLLFGSAVLSFLSTGFLVWLPLMFTWVVIPLLELFLPPDPSNLSEAEEIMARDSRVYDWLLYAVVPVQYGCLILFLFMITRFDHHWIDLLGKVYVMGLLCGVMGINVGHELGHRRSKVEQFLAKALLLTSLYQHFFVEHNRGHHKRVATPEDPSSARYGEPLYSFYFRSIIQSYLSAWHIAANEARKKGLSPYSLHNEMVQLSIAQLLFVAAIFSVFGAVGTVLFIIAAGHGILLLEAVNYIEHYGLQRKAVGVGKYERARPHHSWNSDHPVGRIMLFELSRHSDHHYLASRKYQILRHHDGAPQMPTGYPGMMLLASLPPAWFYVMNKRIKDLEKSSSKGYDAVAN